MAVSFSISELRTLSEQLSQQLGLPFKHMTHSFLKRRFAMFFDKHALRKPEHLLQKLNDDAFVDDLCHFFSVNTTELFRDAGFWRHLRKLITTSYTGQSIKIWMPDGSSGEELYSLLILLKEANCLDQAFITVNSTSEEGIKNLSKGGLLMKKMDVNAYNYKRFEGNSSLDSYFIDSTQTTCLDASLLKNVRFQKGCIEYVNDSDKFDIIILRNSLLYYTKDYHDTIKGIVDKALVSGGYLCLGVKEQLPLPYDNRFECVDVKEKIYNKIRFLKD